MIIFVVIDVEVCCVRLTSNRQSVLEVNQVCIVKLNCQRNIIQSNCECFCQCLPRRESLLIFDVPFFTYRVQIRIYDSHHNHILIFHDFNFTSDVYFDDALVTKYERRFHHGFSQKEKK